jgi:hypothetical protein
MSPITSRPQPLALAALLITLAACSTASAQRYGQNPAPSGVFVPLADGPVLAGTTGTPVNTNTTTTTSSSSTAFGTGSNPITLNNGMQLGFNNGQLTFTVTQTANSGWFDFLSAFGDMNFSFVTMSGTQVHIQSNLAADAVTFNVTFGNNLFTSNPNTDTTNGGLPDANPVNNPNGGIDGSPGNPLGGT